MKVIVLKGFVYDKKPQKIGAKVDVKEHEAQALIAAGRAADAKDEGEAKKALAAAKKTAAEKKAAAEKIAATDKAIAAARASVNSETK